MWCVWCVCVCARACVWLRKFGHFYITSIGNRIWVELKAVTLFQMLLFLTMRTQKFKTFIK